MAGRARGADRRIMAMTMGNIPYLMVA